MRLQELLLLGQVARLRLVAPLGKKSIRRPCSFDEILRQFSFLREERIFLNRAVDRAVGHDLGLAPLALPLHLNGLRLVRVPAFGPAHLGALQLLLILLGHARAHERLRIRNCPSLARAVRSQRCRAQLGVNRRVRAFIKQLALLHLLVGVGVRYLHGVEHPLVEGAAEGVDRLVRPRRQRVPLRAV